MKLIFKAEKGNIELNQLTNHAIISLTDNLKVEVIDSQIQTRGTAYVGGINYMEYGSVKVIVEFTKKEKITEMVNGTTITTPTDAPTLRSPRELPEPSGQDHLMKPKPKTIPEYHDLPMRSSEKLFDYEEFKVNPPVHDIITKLCNSCLNRSIDQCSRCRPLTYPNGSFKGLSNYRPKPKKKPEPKTMPGIVKRLIKDIVITDEDMLEMKWGDNPILDAARHLLPECDDRVHYTVYKLVKKVMEIDTRKRMCKHIEMVDILKIMENRWKTYQSTTEKLSDILSMDHNSSRSHDLIKMRGNLIHAASVYNGALKKQVDEYIEK